MITSADNEQLKTVRKLQQKSWRDKLDLFCAEGEDLAVAAEAAGWEPETLLVAAAGAAGGVTPAGAPRAVSPIGHTPRTDVEPELLAAVSTLGSGTRAIGIYRRRWSEPGGELSVYLHGVGDPGNVGAVLRAAHAFCDGPLVLGPGCADPFSPKAVRASMGSLFARPPARAQFAELPGTTLALHAHAESALDDVPHERPLVICLGAERDGLPPQLLEAADRRARIPLRADGPESLNVAMAATLALYAANRMAGHG